MQKTPDEIKRSLRVHAFPHSTGCNGCAYYDKKAHCSERLLKDVFVYIQQLESKLNQAVEDIRMLGRTGEFICPVCAHYNHGEGTKGECVKCLTGDGFRWRGEKEEETNC
jgi:hypothetical protein